MALSLILLVGAGLLIRSFGELMGAERGFETENRLIASVNVPDSYGPEEALDFNRTLVERVSALPPVVQCRRGAHPAAGRRKHGPGLRSPGPARSRGGHSLGILASHHPGLLQDPGGPDSSGVGTSLRTIWPSPATVPSPSSSASGSPNSSGPGRTHSVRVISLWAGQDDRPGEVLGVVGDMRERGIDAGPTLAVYLPYFPPGWPPDLVVHTAGSPPPSSRPSGRSLAEMDPNIPLSDIATLEEMVGQSVGSQRFLMVLVSLFASLALLLALAGVYGVQSYSVAQQTSEIGIRVAIGASRPQILRRSSSRP